MTGFILHRYLDLAEEVPDSLAIIYERPPFAGQSLTWAQLAQRGRDLARDLRSAGVQPRSRCAFTLGEHPDTLPLLLVLWQLDASAILIDEFWGEERQKRVATHGGATFAIDLRRDPICARFSSATPEVETEALPEDTAFLGYTSGSSGDPKGVTFTHSKLGLTLQAAAAAMTLQRGQPSRRIACSMRPSGSGVLNLHYTWAVFSYAQLASALGRADRKRGKQRERLLRSAAESFLAKAAPSPENGAKLKYVELSRVGYTIAYPHPEAAQRGKPKRLYRLDAVQ